MDAWKPDDTPLSAARLRDLFAALCMSSALDLVERGKVAKPERGSATWRAACKAYDLADHLLGKRRSDAARASGKETETPPEGEEGAHGTTVYRSPVQPF